MKKKNSKLTNVLVIVIFIIGLSLVLYPTVSDYWNSFHQTQAIVGYSEAVKNIDSNQFVKYWEQADAYNKSLISKANRWILSEEECKLYQNILNVSGTGILGYIEIPSIQVMLPVYHGVEESVLQIAVGHIEGSSLPVGGESTHSVLSGHRGLPSAKLFTNLDQMAEGDLFMLNVLDRTLTYQVDQILIVEPEDLSALEIEQGKDYCTLVTCTPYGVNSHRILVRGYRVDNIPEDVQVVADALEIDPIIVATAIGAIMLALFLIVVMIATRKKK